MEEKSNAREFGPQEVEFFWRISTSVVSGRYLKEILQFIVSLTAEKLDAAICSIFLLDQKRQELAIGATQALSEEYIQKPNLKVGESVSGRVVKERRPIAVLDVTLEKGFRYPDIARRAQIVSMLSVPMMVGSRVVGVVNVFTAEPHAFSEAEIKLLQAVANQAAVAIQNTGLQEEVVEARHNVETSKQVGRAKAVLAKAMNLSEDEAHRLLMRSSRNSRKPLREVAEAVLLAFAVGKKPPL